MIALENQLLDPLRRFFPGFTSLPCVLDGLGELPFVLSDTLSESAEFFISSLSFTFDELGFDLPLALDFTTIFGGLVFALKDILGVSSLDLPPVCGDMSCLDFPPVCGEESCLDLPPVCGEESCLDLPPVCSEESCLDLPPVCGELSCLDLDILGEPETPSLDLLADFGETSTDLPPLFDA